MLKNQVFLLVFLETHVESGKGKKSQILVGGHLLKLGGEVPFGVEGGVTFFGSRAIPLYTPFPPLPIYGSHSLTTLIPFDELCHKHCFMSKGLVNL